MNPEVCCKNLGRGDSPFEIIMLGWQDGLTSGMARCRACGTTYHFEMVAWDQEQEVRIYGFREVSQASYDAVVALHLAPSVTENPLERSDALALKARDALATGFERIFYAAATNLAKEVIAARRVGFTAWKELLAF